MAFLKVNGFHTAVSGNATGIGDFLRKVDAAGVPFLAYCADATTSIMDAQRIMKSSDVPHNAIFRRINFPHTQDGGNVPDYNQPPKEAARLHWDSHVERWPPELDPLLIWGETINELRKEVEWADWIGEFCYETALMALADNRRWCGPGYSSGTPDEGSWETPGMKKFLRICAAHPDDIAVALHEYSFTTESITDGDGWKVGRFRLLIDACERMGIAPPTIFMTEWGWAERSVPEPNTAMQHIMEAGALYAEYPTVKGCAIWGLDGGWGNLANETHALMEPLADLLTWKRYPGHPEPPPPPAPVNVLVNPSFEDLNWNDIPAGVGNLINQEPAGWKLEWTPIDQQIEGRDFTATGIPECVHKSTATLPEDEWPGGENALILDGDITYNIFRSHGARWQASLSQIVSNLAPGSMYAFIVNAQVHYHDTWKEGVNDNADFHISVFNGSVGKDYWTPMLPDKEFVRIVVESKVPENGRLTVSVSATAKWEHPRDLFLDAFALELVEPAPPPLPPTDIPSNRADMPLIVDLSKWNGTVNNDGVLVTDTIDMDVITADGSVQGFIVRAAGGVTVDPLYDDWIALFNGAPHGNYHWLAPGLSAERQADVFLDTRTPGVLGDWLDVERNATIGVPTPEQVIQFDKRYKERTGMLPGIYTNFDTWQFYIKLFGPEFAKRKLWIANHEASYGSLYKPLVPPPWDGNDGGVTNAVIKYWQYGMYATPGYSKGQLDNNAFHGSQAEYDIMVGSELPPETPECRGEPRVDYPRTVLVAPDGMARDAWLKMAGDAFDKKQTIGFSYDDAGIGNLSVRTAVLYGIEPEGQAEFLNWYAYHYPGVIVEFRDTPKLPPVTPPQTTVRIGLHASADGGDMTEMDRQEFRDLQPGVIKVLSSQSRASVSQLAADHPAAVFIIRAFLSFGNRMVSAGEFVDWTVGDVQRAIGAIGADREIWIELHNEPNLVMEGCYHSWPDGAGFNDWYLEVIRLYRRLITGGNVHYLFPGLSPGAGVIGVKQDSQQFHLQCVEAITASDGLAVHAYWATQDGWPMEKTFEQIDWIESRFYTMPLWITEASNNRDGLSPEEKASEYNVFLHRLGGYFNMRGVTYFIASASNPDWGWETGSCETWTPVRMARKVRALM